MVATRDGVSSHYLTIEKRKYCMEEALAERRLNPHREKDSTPAAESREPDEMSRNPRRADAGH
jgi:hypothetical protein